MMTTRPPILLFLLLFAVASAPRPALPFPIRAEDMAGVWRLSSRVLFLPPPPSSSPGASGPDDDDGWGGGDDGTLLVLRADGTFAPCRPDEGGGGDGGGDPTEGAEAAAFALGGPPSGLWDYDPSRGEASLVLVPDRPAGADGRRVRDVALRGAVSSSPSIAAADGTVSVGRCAYPRSHPRFFDAPGPLIRRTDVGTFRMSRVLRSPRAGPEEGDEDDEEDEYEEREGGGDDAGPPAFRDEDFFGRRFLLTVEPLPSRRRGADEEEAATTALDLRVLPVEFHGNRTFAARGVNKILRGRFRVDGGRGKNLVMDVSLFGAGRSVSGSVYSEGKGLTHEDERSYSGEILATEDEGRGLRTLFVRGNVVFGTDLGTDARPEPVGLFSMMEVRDDFDSIPPG